MGQKIKLDQEEYDVDNMSEQAKATVIALQFAETRIIELQNMQALLHRAKNSYIESLKQELLSNKAGILFEEN